MFDLAALSGIARVLAFLATGLLLLQQGSRVARSTAGTDHEDPHAVALRPTTGPGGPPS